MCMYMYMYMYMHVNKHYFIVIHRRCAYTCTWCVHTMYTCLYNTTIAPEWGMSSSWKKQRLQDHFVVLCNELDVDRIVPVLKAERMLTSDEMEQLTNPHFSTRARREKLLLFIPRKGRSHFEKFAECLVWSGQTELASKIGVPVKDIRPSPHPSEQCPPAMCTLYMYMYTLYLWTGASPLHAL